MELSDIVALTITTTAVAAVASFIGFNLRAYSDTQLWLDSHKISPSWYEKSYQAPAERVFEEKIPYFLGYFGRRIAYKLHSRED